MNGDGVDDVVVGADAVDHGQRDEGAAWVWVGGAEFPGDADGYLPPEDCDDMNPAIHPGATEQCDGTDNNCDGALDEGAYRAWYADVDGDGHGDRGMATWACAPPAGYVADDADCDDSDASVFPGAPEVVADGVDEDCDGGELCYVDHDRDGYRTAETVPSGDLRCVAAGEATADQPDGDCDDTRADVNPAASEIPDDGVDNNCDGRSAITADGGDSEHTPADVPKAGCGCAVSTPAHAGPVLLALLLARRRAHRGHAEVAPLALAHDPDW